MPFVFVGPLFAPSHGSSATGYDPLAIHSLIALTDLYAVTAHQLFNISALGFLWPAMELFEALLVL